MSHPLLDQALDPERLPLIQERIWELVRQAHLDADLRETARPDDFDAFLLRMDGYICEIKDAQIRNGLHVLGVAPEGEQLRARLRSHVERIAPGHSSPIVPIVLGDEARALAASAALLERGLLVPAIRPPTVAPGTSRLRVALSAAHTDDQVALLAQGLREIVGEPPDRPGRPRYGRPFAAKQ